MMNITRKKAVQLMLAATCAWLATGCMQEEWERPEQKVKTTICADIPSEDEDVQTRVTVDRTNYKLYWSENDEITVVGFDESDRFKGLELYNVKEIDETDRRQATFEGYSIPQAIKREVYYPSEKVSVDNQGKVKFYLPTQQFQERKNSTEYLSANMILKGTDEDNKRFQMQPVNSIMVFQFTENKQFENVKNLIWTVETENGDKQISLKLGLRIDLDEDIIDKVYIAFMPDSMSVKPGGKFKVQITSDKYTVKTFQFTTTLPDGKKYEAGKYYTADLMDNKYKGCWEEVTTPTEPEVPEEPKVPPTPITEMKLTLQITSGYTDVILPFSGYTPSTCTVNWGDEYATNDGDRAYYPELTCSSGHDATNYFKHTYKEPGTYQITIKSSQVEAGKAQIASLDLYTEGQNFNKNLVSIDTPLLKMDNGSGYQLFSNCTKLESVAENLFMYNEDILSFNRCFIGCRALKAIPEGLFKNCTSAKDFSNCFYSCDLLTEIPEGLFTNCTSATNFYRCFYYCKALMEIPEELFTNCTSATNFSECFYSCDLLTEIPERLFANCTSATEFNNCFRNCTALTTIPAGLFANCTSATGFNGCFRNCTALTTIPAGLFANCMSATGFDRCFMFCNKVTTIPENLFPASESVKSYVFCFGECEALEKIPEDLFEGNYRATDFSECFNMCSKLKEIPEGLFKDALRADNFKRCFYECKALTQLPEGLFEMNTLATSFYQCFSGCTGLTALPEHLFNCPKVTELKLCFEKCSKIAAIPSDLFTNLKRLTSFEEFFSGWNKLEAIPEGLFDQHPDVTSFKNCFKNCTVLTTIPEGLFDKHLKVTSFEGCFEGCRTLTEVPTRLFASPVATSFSNCFSGCSSLTKVADDLFSRNEAATKFSHCFEACSSLTELPNKLFANNKKATDFSHCFVSCRALTELPDDLFIHNTEATDFSYCFGDCETLTKLPDNLFTYNTKATDFSYCFSYGKLKTVPRFLFATNLQVTTFKACFQNCEVLAPNEDIFCSSSALKTRFATRPDISMCFYNIGSAAESRGPAPKLWQLTEIYKNYTNLCKDCFSSACLSNVQGNTNLGEFGRTGVYVNK